MSIPYPRPERVPRLRPRVLTLLRDLQSSTSMEEASVRASLAAVYGFVRKNRGRLRSLRRLIKDCGQEDVDFLTRLLAGLAVLPGQLPPGVVINQLLHVESELVERQVRRVCARLGHKVIAQLGGKKARPRDTEVADCFAMLAWDLREKVQRGFVYRGFEDLLDRCATRVLGHLRPQSRPPVIRGSQQGDTSKIADARMVRRLEYEALVRYRARTGSAAAWHPDRAPLAAIQAVRKELLDHLPADWTQARLDEAIVLADSLRLQYEHQEPPQDKPRVQFTTADAEGNAILDQIGSVDDERLLLEITPSQLGSLRGHPTGDSFARYCWLEVHEPSVPWEPTLVEACRTGVALCAVLEACQRRDLLVRPISDVVREIVDQRIPDGHFLGKASFTQFLVALEMRRLPKAARNRLDRVRETLRLATKVAPVQSCVEHLLVDCHWRSLEQHLEHDLANGQRAQLRVLLQWMRFAGCRDVPCDVDAACEAVVPICALRAAMPKCESRRGTDLRDLLRQVASVRRKLLVDRAAVTQFDDARFLVFLAADVDVGNRAQLALSRWIEVLGDSRQAGDEDRDGSGQQATED